MSFFAGFVRVSTGNRRRAVVVMLLGTLCAMSSSEAPSAASSASGQAPAGAGVSRTPEGKPDLSGFWQVSNTAAWDIQDHRAQKGIPAGQGVVEAVLRGG